MKALENHQETFNDYNIYVDRERWLAKNATDKHIMEVDAYCVK